MDELHTKKSLGQHWLTDSATLEEMCEQAGVAAADTILEIGPGKGSLTSKLLDRGARVVAVELDEGLELDLREKFKGQPFILNMLSIFDFDLSTLPHGYKIVSNIPYYLTAHLLRMLCETPHPPQVVVLLVQKEVAERVASGPGDMSFISVAVQLNYEVALGRIVPAKLFSPPPKVNSQILIMQRRTEPLFVNIQTKEFFRLVKAGFANRRKTLLNSLSAGLLLSKVAVKGLLTESGIQPSARAQELSMKDWHVLYTKVVNNA